MHGKLFAIESNVNITKDMVDNNIINMFNILKLILLKWFNKIKFIFNHIVIQLKLKFLYKFNLVLIIFKML